MATYIFDFDGTLADSFAIAFEILLTQASALGCKQLHPSDLDKIKQMHARELLKYLHIPFWRVPRFVKKLRKLGKTKIAEVTIFPEWHEVLTHLKNNNHTLGILSSNAHGSVEIVLRKHGLYELFDFVISGRSLFGKGRYLKRLMKQFNCIHAETYYIGDEVRDIEAAKANKIQAIAVAWGFNSPSRLQAAQPTFIIQHPSEILALAD
jgi:HAD superfamily hydrolase (TIGR01549 family)